ncbi:MAG TPA: VOC family protein [Clostridia bacterium]
MQKITPCLWYDNQAEEAANFYTSAFNDSRIINVTHYGDQGADISGKPAGTVMTVAFELDGTEFTALNGGPYFSFTPSISFFVSCENEKEINELWEKFVPGGMILMELGKYPFSERFGWVQDKFGVSWQLSLARYRQKITPFLMFSGDQFGKAEEAINFYISLFSNSSIDRIERYLKGEEEPEGTVKHASFLLDGQAFMAIESSMEHQFTFTEAISLFVSCETQDEIDILWEKLSHGGEKVQCGWLKDRFGVSWQIVPDVLGEMLSDPDPEKSQRVMQAMLQMKKIDIAGLRRAYEHS